MADLLVARPARRRALGWLSAGLLIAAGVTGCQERLTSPGVCPELCPGGQLTVVDTVLDAIPGQDSSYVGYISPVSSEAMLVSSGLPGSEDRAVVRFASRPDSISLNGTAHSYVVDSVAIVFNVWARDTAVDGVRAVLYRLPATIDSTATFADVEDSLVDAHLIDTVAVSNDSVRFTVRALIAGAKLPRVAIPAADSGVLAIGMRIVAPAPTGLRLGTVAGAAATVTAYVTLQDVTEAEADFADQLITRGPSLNTTVSDGTPVLDDDLLQVGGEPSARSLLRFDFPAKLRDSVSIVRATLELVPTATLWGLPNDPTILEARALRSDLGAKSPLCVLGGVCGGVVIGGATFTALEHGSADTVQFEVPQIVRTWQGFNPAPPAMLLRVGPEAATFMRPVFFSTRSGVGAPRLRISYVPISTSP